jgi:tetratricopeptide (TPR) repeat protein
MAAFRKAIELNKDYAKPYTNLGYALLLKGQPHDAIACFSRAIELDPNNVKALSYRADAHAGLGQYDQALADYQTALKLPYASAALCNSLAWMLATCPEAKLRDPARAVALAKRAVQLNPIDTHSWNTLGVALYRAGDWQGALAALERSTVLGNGGNSFDWFFLAMCHEKLGAKEKARVWYGRATGWMEKNQANHEELRRFRAEAAELLNITKGQ